MSNWSPIGFDLYRASYPATPALAAPAHDITADFAREWSATEPRSSQAQSEFRRSTLHHRECTYVFVRGLFGSWIPRHLAEPLARLRAAGQAALIARTRANGTIAVNAALLHSDVMRRVPEGRIVFLCHSKGGLDLLAMLESAPGLRDRTAGIALCQTPRAGCAVLESVLLGAHRESAGTIARSSESVAAVAIRIARARAACLDLTSPRLQRRVAELMDIATELPLVSVASWSSEPTAWLDSQHARLAAVRPRCAHDGLFYLEDLIWPCGRQVLLPRIDHSQLCVGGGGFDHGRFWLALTHLFE